MNKAVRVLLATLIFIVTSIPAIVLATPSDADQLVALGMQPVLAKKLVQVVNTLASPFTNNTYFTFRNAGNTANINGMKVDNSDNTVLNSSASDELIFQLEDDASRLVSLTAASDAALAIKFGDAGTTATQILTLSGSTADADDDSSIRLVGGGAFGTDGTRGATIVIPGEEVAGGSDITYNAGASDTHIFQVAGTAELTLANDAVTFGVVTAGAPLISTASIDAADDNTLSVASGAAATDARGGFVALHGNEVTTIGGGIDLTAGNAASAHVDVNLEHASSTFNVKDTTSGTVLTVTDAGAVTAAGAIAATTGNITSTAGSFVAGTSGGTLHLQEATAGAKCMGTATANGVTAVTVSTTCAVTGARIFISRTSAVAAGVTEPGCWATNISNGVSFDLDCNDAAEDSTFNWLIIKEAA